VIKHRRIIVVCVCVLVLLLAALTSERGLVWNATPSYPEGLYRLHDRHAYGIGDLIYFQPPAAVRSLLYERNYIPQGGELMKQVVALAGDTYCVTEETFSVRGERLGPVFNLDSAGRPLPQIRGCHEVPLDHVLVASPHHRKSFDSRYFGPIPTNSIHGTLEELWIW
jgi:conjugative transfer signal peptidase TraF